jgi:hypothetical protein
MIMSIIADLEKKEQNVEKIANKIIKNNELLDNVFETSLSKKASIKYKSFKVLTYLSEKQPNLLYPSWDFFVKLLDNKNTFLRSIGARIIANLTTIDEDNKFEKIFNKYYSLLNDKSMINSANVVTYSSIIARAKPQLQNKITDKLISIDKTHHGYECKNIIKGKAIQTFEEYFNEFEDKKRIISFVRNERNNSRTATSKKAEKFLKKWDK